MQPAVQAIAGEHETSPDDGFAGLAFEGNGITLYWKGQLTDRMTSAIRTGRKSASVKVVAATYSLAELHAAAESIEADPSVEVSDLQLISYPYDGSHLEVRTMPAASVRALEAKRQSAGQPPLRSIVDIVKQAKVAVPVVYAQATDPVTLDSSRVSDSPPWNGGDRFETWGSTSLDAKAICTTGFGVHSADHSHSWVLTAGHCASMGDELYQGKWGSGSFFDMGPVAKDVWQYDLLLDNAAGWYKIFDGSPTTSTTKVVHSWGYWIANELVCQSGITSGTVCGIKQSYSSDARVDCSHRDSDGDCGYIVKGLIFCTQINGTTAVQPGDSGGPVFTLDGDGVRAKGITDGSSGGEFAFQDWADVIREFNVYPNTTGSLY